MQDRPRFARLGLDSQTMFGLPPKDHIRQAFRLGCGHISIALGPVPWRMDEISDWSLRESAHARREIVRIAADHQISFSLGEGFAIRADKSVRNFADDLDAMAELGVTAVGTVAFETDRHRAIGELAALTEMAAARELLLYLEFAPPHAFPGLIQAAEVVQQIGHPSLKLMLDAMHFFRCGNEIADLSRIPDDLIGRAQISDAPFRSRGKSYMDEACFERMVPGDGELPLAAFIAALPTDILLGLEVPNRAASPDPESLAGHLDRMVSAASDLL